jgi:hypothetical protein
LRHLNPRIRSRGGYNNNRQFTVACSELCFRRLILSACQAHQWREEQLRKKNRKSIVIELVSLAEVIALLSPSYLHRVSKRNSIFSFVGPKALVQSQNLIDNSYQPGKGSVVLVLERLSPDSLRVLDPSAKDPAVPLPLGPKNHTLPGTVGVISLSSVTPMPFKLTFYPRSRQLQILLPYWDVANDNVTVLTTTVVFQHCVIQTPLLSINGIYDIPGLV